MIKAIKAIDQPSTKLVGRSNNKSIKIIYSHDNQLRGIQNQKICKIQWQNIKCGESKIHTHILLYVNLMVTTSQKYITDTHTHTHAHTHAHTHTDRHQITREEKKRRKEKKELQNKLKTVYKVAVSTFLSIITSNVNGLNAPIKRH